MATTGVLTPFCRDAKSDWSNGNGAALYESEIVQALGTRRGELPWDTQRGSRLHLLRHKSVPTEILSDLARVYAMECLANELPNIAVRTVQVSRAVGSDGQYTVLNIDITYDVIDVNSGNTLLSQQSVSVAF